MTEDGVQKWDGPGRPTELHTWASWGASPEEDLAREESLLALAAAGTPAMAFWSWPGPVVVLGHGQPASDADLELCRREGIPVLRRITGGTGVIHADDLAVSLALPAAHPAFHGIGTSYDLLLGILTTVLTQAGIRIERPEARRAPSARLRSPVCFEDVLGETLALAGRKVVGCAQARRRRAVLVHAHLHLEPRIPLYSRIFRLPSGRVAAAVGGVGRGTRPDELARRTAEAAARRLGLGLRWIGPPAPAPAHLHRHRSARWAPVAPS